MSLNLKIGHLKFIVIGFMKAIVFNLIQNPETIDAVSMLVIT